MQKTSFQKIIALITFIALCACSNRPPNFHANDITGADFGQNFTLFDFYGQQRTLADYRHKAVILFFGYTTCPDVCPSTLTRFAEVMTRLGSEAAKVQLLFVTLDPERDTPEKLRSYISWFHPSFIGLYSDPATTARTAKDFKVYYARQEAGGPLAYTIDHSVGAYVYDPSGRLRLYIKDTQTPEEISQDIRMLLSSQ